MSFLFDTTLAFLEKTAGFHMARHEVVASNIANTETPGYAAKEMKFEAFLSRADSAAVPGPVATHPRHIGIPPGAGVVAPPIETEGDPVRVDGNNVVLEKEMTKMAENTVGYMTVMTLAARKLRMLRNAIDDAGRV